MKSTIAQLKNQFETALVNAFGPDLAGTDPILVPASNPKFGDFQANVAMSLAKHLKDKPRAIAEKLVENLDVSTLCEEPAIAGPGFINLKLKPSYINEQLKAIQGDDSSGSLQSNRLGIQPVSEPQKSSSIFQVRILPRKCMWAICDRPLSETRSPECSNFKGTMSCGLTMWVTGARSLAC